MHTRAQGTARLAAIVWIAATVLAAGNVAVLLAALQRGGQAVNWPEAVAQCPFCVGYALLAPLIVAVVAAVVALRGKPSAVAETATQPQNDLQLAATPQEDRSALVLLSLLQREGRLLDFLAEDLTQYSDAQIGAAVRAIHSGCRKALEGRLELEPVVRGEEGQEITLDGNVDPSQIRLAGNVTGSGPYIGVLRHPGWKVRRVELPQPLPGSHPEILAPAEVDLR